MPIERGNVTDIRLRILKRLAGAKGPLSITEALDQRPGALNVMPALCRLGWVATCREGFTITPEGRRVAGLD